MFSLLKAIGIFSLAKFSLWVYLIYSLDQNYISEIIIDIFGVFLHGNTGHHTLLLWGMNPRDEFAIGPIKEAYKAMQRKGNAAILSNRIPAALAAAKEGLHCSLLM